MAIISVPLTLGPVLGKCDIRAITVTHPKFQHRSEQEAELTAGRTDRRLPQTLSERGTMNLQLGVLTTTLRRRQERSEREPCYTRMRKSEDEGILERWQKYMRREKRQKNRSAGEDGHTWAARLPVRRLTCVWGPGRVFSPRVAAPGLVITRPQVPGGRVIRLRRWVISLASFP